MEQEEERFQPENARGDDEGIYTKETVFLGPYSYNTIEDSIDEQFKDYIGLPDETDYVAIFYHQLEQSLAELRRDDEQHPEEKKALLDSVYADFIGLMETQFRLRFNITIKAIDEGDIYNLSLRDTIKALYHYFVLNAKQNIKSVIIMDIEKSVEDVGDNDDTFFHIVEDKMHDHDPIFTTMDVPTFLIYSGNREVYEYFESNDVSGNFLKKLSPKFYINEDFKVDIINAIVIHQQFHKDVYKLSQLEPPTESE